METTKLRLAMELITARAAHEGNNGAGILAQQGASFMESFNDIVDGLASFFTSAPPVAFLPNTYKTVEKSLHGVNYIAISNIGMPVPEGFKGDMAGYAQYLQKSVRACSDVTVMIDTVYRLVSVCLSNPKMPQETTFPVQKKDADHDIEKIKTEISAFIDPNSSNTIVPYGKVIKRNSDWPNVVRETDTLKEMLARLDKKTMLKKAKDLDSAIGKLIEQRKNKPEFMLDTAWLKYVTEQTYEIAVQLEFSAVTYYRCLAYFQSVDEISQKLIAATKE